MPDNLIQILIVGGVGLFLLRLWRKSRAKPRYYGQTFGDPVSPYDKVESEAPSVAGDNLEEKVKRSARLSTIVFLSVWLTGWTIGCFFALRTWVSLSYGEEGFIFLTIWLAMAIPAWFFVAWTLVRMIRGDEVEFSGDEDGDGGD